MSLTSQRSTGMFMKEKQEKEHRVQETSRPVDVHNLQRQLHALATGVSYYGAAASSTSRGDNNVHDCHYPDQVRAVDQKHRLSRHIVV